QRGNLELLAQGECIQNLERSNKLGKQYSDADERTGKSLGLDHRENRKRRRQDRNSLSNRHERFSILIGFPSSNCLTKGINSLLNSIDNTRDAFENIFTAIDEVLNSVKDTETHTGIHEVIKVSRIKVIECFVSTLGELTQSLGSSCAKPSKAGRDKVHERLKRVYQRIDRIDDDSSLIRKRLNRASKAVNSIRCRIAYPRNTIDNGLKCARGLNSILDPDKKVSNACRKIQNTFGCRRNSFGNVNKAIIEGLENINANLEYAKYSLKHSLNLCSIVFRQDKPTREPLYPFCDGIELIHCGRRKNIIKCSLDRTHHSANGRHDVSNRLHEIVSARRLTHAIRERLKANITTSNFFIELSVNIKSLLDGISR